MVEQLWERYLGRELDVDLEIRWDDAMRGYGADCYAYASHDGDEYEIVIDWPLREMPRIPLYVIRDIVWHECAHVIRCEQTGDLDAEHSPAFRVIESLHVDRLRAESWMLRHGAQLDDVIERRRADTKR